MFNRYGCLYLFSYFLRCSKLFCCFGGSWAPAKVRKQLIKCTLTYSKFAPSYFVNQFWSFFFLLGNHFVYFICKIVDPRSYDLHLVMVCKEGTLNKYVTLIASLQSHRDQGVVFSCECSGFVRAILWFPNSSLYIFTQPQTSSSCRNTCPMSPIVLQVLYFHSILKSFLHWKKCKIIV